MTRKQALQSVLELLYHEPVTSDNMRVIEKVKEIINDLPLNKWTAKTIHDTIQQWAIEHGKNPTSTDFKKRDLPPHPVIKLRFGINLKEFLAQNYPQPKRMCKSKIYGDNSKEEWKEIFVKEFKRIAPKSANEYNKYKKQNYPTWKTVAKMFDITSWNEFLKFCNINKRRVNNFIVSQHINALENINLLKNREDHN